MRGTLLELEVKLRADPVFRMSSIISEIASMSEEHADVFGTPAAGLIPGQMKSMGKLLDRFMAGLVPIRSVVTNVRLYESDDEQYLVEASIAEQLNLPTTEIELVGVLERDRFWKDMRRVLFSDARVTVLGRVSIDGLQDSWTPVKQLDLFRNTIPGGEDAIAAFQNITFDEGEELPADQDNAFGRVLDIYASLIVADGGRQLSEQEKRQLDASITVNRVHGGRADSERQAFRDVNDQLARFGFSNTEPERDADLRHEARIRAAAQTPDSADASSDSQTPEREADRHLVEVEVIAMYW
ncbi:hypothetical protein AS181_24305 [Gordonia sp. SGD-V-85]|nr:hypothetical protein AS181_24305 [Gordonia sp. SGD-V-85]